MVRRILIDAAYAEHTRVAVIHNQQLVDYDDEWLGRLLTRGNIYLAKVIRIEQGLQAAFLDYGGGKQGFLPFSEIHPDYYQVPVADRALLAQQARSGLRQEEDIDTEGMEAEVSSSVLRDDASDVRAPELEVVDRQDSDGTMTPQDSEAAAEPVAVVPEGDELKEAEHEAPELQMEVTESPVPGSSGKELPIYRRYKIQEVIRRGQVLLVQVTKEERGNKGASLTTYISLAGRYCVLMPNSVRQGGVSRRIMDGNDRRRLKEVIAQLEIPANMSVIVRTAGSNRQSAEIRRDYDYLARLWNNIRDHTLRSTAPAFIHAEGDLLKRTLRDMYNQNIDEILIQGEKSYQEAVRFVELLMPDQVHRVKHYQQAAPIFHRYKVEEQLSRIYKHQVALPSGGSIVIHPTEALVSIDVNSGRSTSERTVEETAFKTNVEAAHEIARQIRLRDLAGIIAIDFIDLEESKHRHQLERIVREAVAVDRARLQIGRISQFGILEMSRQRMRPNVVELHGQRCHHCDGLGMVRHVGSLALSILRQLEIDAQTPDIGRLTVVGHPEVLWHVTNHMRRAIVGIEVRYALEVIFEADVDGLHDTIKVIKTRRQAMEQKKKPVSLSDIDAIGMPELDLNTVVLDESLQESHEEGTVGSSLSDGSAHGSGDGSEINRGDGSRAEGSSRRRDRRRRRSSESRSLDTVAASSDVLSAQLAQGSVPSESDQGLRESRPEGSRAPGEKLSRHQRRRLNRRLSSKQEDGSVLSAAPAFSESESVSLSESALENKSPSELSEPSTAVDRKALEAPKSRVRKDKAMAEEGAPVALKQDAASLPESSRKRVRSRSRDRRSVAAVEAGTSSIGEGGSTVLTTVQSSSSPSSDTGAPASAVSSMEPLARNEPSLLRGLIKRILESSSS